MKKLYFDIQITGHHSEYIGHLIDYLSVNGCGIDTYYFVVHPRFKDEFPSIWQKTVALPNFHWISCTEEEFFNCGNTSAFKNSFVSLQLVNKYAKKIQADHVCLLSFNIFQLALIFCRTPYSISGILFLQFYRMEKKQLKDKIKYYRKYLTTKLLTFNPKVKWVFILNDQKTVDYLNSEFKTNLFKILADPIPVYNKEDDFDVYDHYNIPKNKKILLHPGAIDPRKGTYEIIDSIDFLQNKETDEYAILIVGKAKSDIENIIRRKLSILKNKDFIVVFDNSFVSNERLKSVFLQSFAVLMPYKNVEASSGILGHATIANKCVIAPASGLTGEIIKKYKLGVLIDKSNAIDIAKGIKRLGNFNNDKTLATKFVSEHTVEAFTSCLLN